MQSNIFSLISFLCVIFGYSDAANYKKATDLYARILSDVTKSIRPHSDSAVATDISIGFSITNLKEINEVVGTVSITGYFSMSWVDHSFSGWNPNTYQGLDTLVLPAADIWTPPLTNLNSVKDLKLFGLSDVLATAKDDGTVSLISGENLEFTCDFDATYFPFDTQECTLDIISWGYEVAEVTFTATSATVNTTSYATNGEWDLTETTTTASNTGSYATMKLKFKFKRRSFFLMVTLVIPIVFLSFLNLAVFFLPHESGERIGYAITIFLALVVYLSVAQWLIPPASIPRLSDFCILLTIDLGLSGMIMVTIVIIWTIFNKPDKEPIPDWVKDITMPLGNKVGSTEDGFLEKKIGTGERKMLPPGRKVAWPDVASFVDTVCAVVYILLAIAGNLFYVLDIIINSE